MMRSFVLKRDDGGRSGGSRRKNRKPRTGRSARHSVGPRQIGIEAAIETTSNMISVFRSRVDRAAERSRLEQIVLKLRKLTR